MIKNLISIIVPIYGVSKYINKCVESLIQQTYLDIEILLVDDGGNDECPKIIDEWALKDKRIVPLHKSNGGVSSARNYGLDHSHGEFITFVDGDDWVESSYCVKLFQAIKMYDSQISICFFNRCKETKKIPSKKFLSSDEYYYYLKIEDSISYFLDYSIAVWGKMFTRECIGNNRFPVGQLAEEYPFFIDIIPRCNSVAFCNNYLYNYRVRSDSLCHSIKPSYLLDNINSLRLMYLFCFKNFPSQSEKVFKRLCSLTFEFSCAKEFSRELLTSRKNEFESALLVVGDIDSLFLKMDSPMDTIFYSYIMFNKIMNAEEKKTLQKYFRILYKKSSKVSFKKKMFKYLPSFISLKLTAKLKMIIGS